MLSLTEEAELLGLLEADDAERATGRLWHLFPDCGPLQRWAYPKHLRFFAGGRAHRERLFIAANRIGKTRAACYELALHLTGLYPDWWEGRRFDHPIRAWAAGTSSKKVKEILQEELFGPVGAWGTGMLPKSHLLHITKAASSIADLIETATVYHISGGTSVLTLKYYEQGREAFEGTFQDVILEDEEPPLVIHAENVLRTMDTTGTGERNGVVMTTFTPLEGLSDTVMHFLPDGQIPEEPTVQGRSIVNATWDDVPHLDAATKAELLATIPPYQRDARSRGIPVLGAGVIYPVAEDDYLVDDFAMPRHWRRAYALDVGWNRTAALWGAYDADQDTWTLYREYYRGQAEPSIHATAIKAPGEWICGVIDPAARGRSQVDGQKLIETYTDLGLHLSTAVNAVESGLYEVWERLSTGRLKVCRSLTNWRKEVRLYRRDDKGHIIKKDDHLMDDTRYLVMSGAEVAQVQPVGQTAYYTLPPAPLFDARGWQGG
jgi:phage terminase large subunit-like protein